MHKEGSTVYEDDENYRDPTGFVEIVEFSSPSSDTLILNISYKPHLFLTQERSQDVS